MKRIRSNRELAIHGATPAFSKPLHVGRPKIGNYEHFLELSRDILETGMLTNDGPLVRRLEQKIAELHGVRHCVAICNGTIALEIAIRALKLEGEVIVPSYTFIATAHALSWQGITPVFADIDPDTHNLDPDAVRAMITPRTTGIIGVHLWGRPAPIDALESISEEYGLKLIFDSAHAFGCNYKGRKIGNFGRCEVLSFHATKIFNTFEGGAILTNDDDLANDVRLMRNFGFSGYDNVIHPGTNGKMPEINAAMGLVNLESLADFVADNKRGYEHYVRMLREVPSASVIGYDTKCDPNYQYVVVELEGDMARQRDALVSALQAENVLARKYFWPGCHRMKPYRDLFPHAHHMLRSTEQVAARTIVLPNVGRDESAISIICDVFAEMLCHRE